MNYPKLEEVFPYVYQGGGYFRMKNAPKKIPAPTLHGEQAIEFLYEEIKNFLTSQEKGITYTQ